MWTPVWILAFLTSIGFQVLRNRFSISPKSVELHAQEPGDAVTSEDPSSEGDVEGEGKAFEQHDSTVNGQDDVVVAVNGHGNRNSNSNKFPLTLSEKQSKALLSEVLVTKDSKIVSDLSVEDEGKLNAVHMEKRHLLPIVPRAILPGGSGFDPAVDVIIDVGAHVGAAVSQLRSVCLRCRIIAIECVPIFAAYIRKKFKDDEGVEVLNVCLDDIDGMGAMGDSKDVEGTADGGETHVTVYRKLPRKGAASDDPFLWSLTKPDAEKAKGGIEEIQVRRARFDDLAVGLGLLGAAIKGGKQRDGAVEKTPIIPKNIIPFIVKIDTEGGEAGVLGGMDLFLNAVARQKSPVLSHTVLLIQAGWVRSDEEKKVEISVLEKLEKRGWATGADFRECPKGQGCDLVFVRPVNGEGYSGGVGIVGGAEMFIIGRVC